PFFRGLGAALADGAPEVVHAHTFGTNQVAVAGRYRRRTGTPLVLTAHFHPIWSIEGGWLRHRIRGFYDRRLAGRVLADVDRLIVQTHEEERLMRSLGVPLPPVEILPPGYTPRPAGDLPSFARATGVPGPYVLFVGRLASNKGLLELVEAFARLAREDPAATLVLVGADGGMAAAVDARARERGVADRVRRVGFVEDPALLAAAYREARVLVLPSEYEAFGLVLLEALAEGTPVVASRVGGIPEIVEDGVSGLLVPPKSADDLFAALARLWADPELGRRLGDAGRTGVVPRFTWDGLADRLDRIYRELARR
ncbi:MAG TPA: glycosyltransferase family 4 protein, partial [Thermoplasmata archaeon]|nr:glycosyltransferase family 4 protein [Thermoplasmata archaeon]